MWFNNLFLPYLLQVCFGVLPDIRWNELTSLKGLSFFIFKGLSKGKEGLDLGTTGKGILPKHSKPWLWSKEIFVKYHLSHQWKTVWVKILFNFFIVFLFKTHQSCAILGIRLLFFPQCCFYAKKLNAFSSFCHEEEEQWASFTFNMGSKHLHLKLDKMIFQLITYYMQTELLNVLNWVLYFTLTMIIHPYFGI